MDPMQRIVNCYQTYSDEARTQALNTILSDKNNRKLVNLWLTKHPVDTPMLTDLRNRITPAAGTPVFDQKTHDVERKILGGKFTEVLDEFTKSPDALTKQIDLIKAHVELKTVTSNELQTMLPLLLDQASTVDILQILEAAEPLKRVPPSLSPLQQLRLSSILVRLSKGAGRGVPLPPLAKAFMQIVQKPKMDLANDIQAINKLEEKEAALACYIERYKIPLSDVKKHLNDEEFLRLAPHLRFVNFYNFDNSALAQNFLKNCANLTVLLINNKILEGVKELSCKSLLCRSDTLSSLPDLPLCEKLDCNGCTALSALPDLPLCKRVDCSSCSALSSIGALPLCQEFNCEKCPALRALPALPACQKLYCSSCPSLSALPDLPCCTLLECNSNPALKELPALPLCQRLYCMSCTGLSALPALPLCKGVYCSSCTALTVLPAIPFCEGLDCSECIALSALPPLPRCLKLSCFECTALNALPALPRCRELRCYGCPLTELPEMRWDADVVSTDEGRAGLPFTSLDINVEKFSTEPVSLLLQLGNHLLHNKPFPNIYYFEKGKRGEAVDFGGVRRDFVTKLAFNLFNANGLKQEDNIPAAASDNEEKAYRSLGRVLAQCYPENSLYKTGPLFSPEVYQCLLQPNPASDEWFLMNYLTLVNASDAVKKVIVNQEVSKLQNNDLTTLAYLIEPDTLDSSKYTQDYFSNTQNLANLRQEMINRAKQDSRLKAISWMAQEMRAKVPDLGGNLKERIEGELNPKALKRKLAWELTHPEDPRFTKTQEYLAHWIDRHEEQLDKFVYAITGIRTLCAANLKIQVFDRDKDFIPVAHTCFFALELSANYIDQAAFDKKIEYFLENALAGSGFTMA